MDGAVLFSRAMLFFQGEGDPLLVDTPAWVFEGIFWLAIVAVLLLAGIATALGLFMKRLRETSQWAERLAVLDELQHSLDRLISDRDDLDLRDLEHVLIDIREGQKHLDDALMRFAEKTLAKESNEAVLVPAERSEHLVERVTNRMLAMGYDRIEIASAADEVEDLAQAAGDGEVLVEARRDGVLHKGRVRVRNGRLQEVEVQPTYSIFP